MTAAQARYVEKARFDNPGWTVRCHDSAHGTVIVEVGQQTTRWRVEGLARVSPEGRVVDWSSA